MFQLNFACMALPHKSPPLKRTPFLPMSIDDTLTELSRQLLSLSQRRKKKEIMNSFTGPGIQFKLGVKLNSKKKGTMGKEYMNKRYPFA